MLNADGSIFKAKGEIDLPIYGRSAIKALQALGMIRSGLKVTPKQLALVCASHAGSQAHLDVVLSILHDNGLTEGHLRNAKDKPLGDDERINWGSKDATRITQNCSGKHAGMLATCMANDWNLENYLSPTHPLQVAILQEIESLTGEKVARVTADGCGAPLFAFTTLGLAKAFHAITVSKDPIHQEVLSACMAYPELVAGNGRLATRMMQGVPGLFMKEGAEAVLATTFSDGRTLVFKITDGALRPLGPIIAAAFAMWGIKVPEEPILILGGDTPVGSIEALL